MAFGWAGVRFATLDWCKEQRASSAKQFLFYFYDECIHRILLDTNRLTKLM